MAGARWKWRVLTGLLVLAGLPASAARRNTPVPRVPRPSLHFERIGHHPLPNPGGTLARGHNGPMAIAGDCLYVGSRIGHRPGTGPASGTAPLPAEVLIVDISRPRRPLPVGALRMPPGAATRELLTVPDARTLIVVSQGGAVNGLQVHDLTDCRRPVLRQTLRFGADRPQGLFLWRDPREPSRFLLYASVLPDDAHGPALRVFELMAPPDGPISPEPVAAFTVASAVPREQPASPWLDEAFIFGVQPREAQRPYVTSVSVSPDGMRVYAADSQGGSHVLDSSRLANREPCTRGPPGGEKHGPGPGECLRALSQDAAARSSGPCPRGPGLSSGACRAPWAQRLGSEEPSPPLVFSRLLFSAWASAGLRAFDISNPTLPTEAGTYVPRPAARGGEPPRAGTSGEPAASPLLYNGLLYLTDESSGLYVLRYKGPRAAELPRTGLHASNTHSLAPPSRALQARAERNREKSTRR